MHHGRSETQLHAAPWAASGTVPAKPNQRGSEQADLAQQVSRDGQRNRPAFHPAQRRRNICAGQREPTVSTHHSEIACVYEAMEHLRPQSGAPSSKISGIVHQRINKSAAKNVIHRQLRALSAADSFFRTIDSAGRMARRIPDFRPSVHCCSAHQRKDRAA